MLDAGCGTGMDTVILSKQGNKVVGIDISPKAVKMARERAKKEKAKDYFVIGDLEKLPFKDRVFDACFIGWTLHHFPEIRSVILEVARVLKTGGTIHIAEPNGSSPAVKIISSLKKMFARLIKETCTDSPNETLHSAYHYTEILRACGFTSIKIGSCYFGGLPPLPKVQSKSLKKLLCLYTIDLLARVRRVFYLLVNKVPLSSLKGVDLVITAYLKKREEDHEITKIR
ncbi:class I SAM-dependent methyltransferase [Dehalococcoidales bacterium]|nr:class I SAM-dependent methyltransferase [Dehalococcoidales bacterium]